MRYNSEKSQISFVSTGCFKSLIKMGKNHGIASCALCNSQIIKMTKLLMYFPLIKKSQMEH